MSLSNALIYNNRLVCGSEEVAHGRLSLSLPHLAPPPSPGSGCDKGWIERAIDPSQPVVFLNTDGCSSARETVIGDYICNEFEASLVRELVLAMIKVGKHATCTLRGNVVFFLLHTVQLLLKLIGK